MKKQLQAGDTFGPFFLLERLGEKRYDDDTVRRLWRVRCKCGKILVKKNNDVRRRKFCSKECPRYRVHLRKLWIERRKRIESSWGFK